MEIRFSVCVNEKYPEDQDNEIIKGIYKSYLHVGGAQKHTEIALYSGAPYVRGFSGHTTVLLHLAAEARKNGYQVDPRYVVLLVMLWAVNRGRHATYGVLLTADHFNDALSLNLGTFGRDLLSGDERRERLEDYALLVGEKDEQTRRKAIEGLKKSIMRGCFVPDLAGFLHGFEDAGTKKVIEDALLHAKSLICPELPQPRS